MHDFQREMPPVIDLQWAQHRNTEYIGILKQLEKDIGKQRLLKSPACPGRTIQGISITEDL